MSSEQKTATLLVFTLWAAGLGAAAQFAKVSAIFPAIQAMYPDAGAGLGFVVSLISFLGIGFGLVAGLIIGRVGFRRLLLSALVLGALMSLWQSTFPALPLMLLSRLLEGASHLTIVVAAPTLIAQVCAKRHRFAAMTLWSTFFGVSFALTVWLGVPLVATHGPASLFIAHAGFMLFVAGVLWVLLPRIATNETQPPLSFRGLLAQHLAIYRSPQKTASAIGWLFYTLTFVSLLTVLPTLVEPDQRAFVAGLMPLAGLAVSVSFGLALMRIMPATKVVIWGFGLAISFVGLIVLMPGQIWLYVVLGGALGLVQGASFAAIPQLNSDISAQAEANGAMAQMGNLGNTLGTPILLALLAGVGFNGMMGFVALCYAAGLGMHLHQQRVRGAMG